jgi:uncharacterized protein (UPF0332 family)
VTPETRELARHRLGRSRQTLAEARTLLQVDSFNGAINRFYYSAYHAARALLATRDLDTSRHSSVIALFQQHFVKTGLLPTNAARALPRAFEKRLNGDYEDFAEVTSDDAHRVAAEVEVFVDSCERLLEQELLRAE